MGSTCGPGRPHLALSGHGSKGFAAHNQEGHQSPPSNPRSMEVNGSTGLSQPRSAWPVSLRSQPCSSCWAPGLAAGAPTPGLPLRFEAGGVIDAASQGAPSWGHTGCRGHPEKAPDPLGNGDPFLEEVMLEFGTEGLLGVISSGRESSPCKPEAGGPGVFREPLAFHCSSSVGF